MSGRLGELLVRENLITPQAFRRAEEESQKSGTRIAAALIKAGPSRSPRSRAFSPASMACPPST